METTMRTMNSFRDVMSSTSTQTLFRTSTRSGSVLNIFVPTTTQSQDMTSVTNTVGLKQLRSPGTPEAVSAFLYILIDEGKSVSLVYVLRRRCSGHMV